MSGRFNNPIEIDDFVSAALRTIRKTKEAAVEYSKVASDQDTINIATHHYCGAIQGVLSLTVQLNEMDLLSDDNRVVVRDSVNRASDEIKKMARERESQLEQAARKCLETAPETC